jgi:hypothetical protein
LNFPALTAKTGLFAAPVNAVTDARKQQIMPTALVIKTKMVYGNQRATSVHSARLSCA